MRPPPWTSTCSNPLRQIRWRNSWPTFSSGAWHEPGGDAGGQRLRRLRAARRAREAREPIRCDVRFAADDRLGGLRADRRYRCRREHGTVGTEGVRRVSASAAPLIEPQSACQAELQAFASTRGSVEIHQTAVTRPGRASVRMAGATPGSTGTHVLGDGEHAENEISLPATTLDSLFSGRVGH